MADKWGDLTPATRDRLRVELDDPGARARLLAELRRQLVRWQNEAGAQAWTGWRATFAPWSAARATAAQAVPEARGVDPALPPRPAAPQRETAPPPSATPPEQGGEVVDDHDAATAATAPTPKRIRVEATGVTERASQYFKVRANKAVQLVSTPRTYTLLHACMARLRARADSRAHARALWLTRAGACAQAAA
jgi:hypothetical protein